MGLAAHLDQFLAIWSEYGLVSTSYNNDPHNRVLVMMIGTREWFVYKHVETNIASELAIF